MTGPFVLKMVRIPDNTLMGKVLKLRTAVVEHLPTHRGKDAFRNRSRARHLEKVRTGLLNSVLHRIFLLRVVLVAETAHPQSDCRRETASTVRTRSLPSFPDHSMDWPGERPISAAPTGVRTEILPALMSAFSGSTSCTFRRRPSSTSNSMVEPMRTTSVGIAVSGQTSARSSSLRSAADTSGARREAAVAIAVSRFSSAVLMRMCGNKSIVVGVDIGNPMALGSRSQKEHLAQTPDNEAARDLLCDRTDAAAQITMN